MPVPLTKISAIITTYNSEKTIARVIHSILNQEGLNSTFEIEIIVVDDCSSDRTVEIISEFGLSYISTGINSKGPNKGRKIGLERATGEFICIVDHDDEWHANRIERVLPFLKMAKIVTSGYILKDAATARTTVRACVTLDGKDHRVYGINETFKSRLKRSHNGQNTYLGSIIYSAELTSIRFEEKFGMIDYDWLLHLLLGQRTVEVCEALYTRHVEGSNLSLNENYRLNDFKLSIEAVNEFKPEFPNEVKESIKKIHGSLGRYYYLTGDMKSARKYLLRSSLNLVTLMYLITSWAGSGFVKRNFKVFG